MMNQYNLARSGERINNRLRPSVRLSVRLSVSLSLRLSVCLSFTGPAQYVKMFEPKVTKYGTRDIQAPRFLHCALSLAAQCIVIGPVCVCVCLWVCLFVCLWVCCRDNSKLREPIFTKLGL